MVDYIFVAWIRPHPERVFALPIIGPHPPSIGAWHCSHHHQHSPYSPSTSSTKSGCSFGTFNNNIPGCRLYLHHPAVYPLKHGEKHAAETM